METMEKISVSDLSIGDYIRVKMCKGDYDDPDTLDAKVLSIVDNSVGVGYDNSGIVMSAFVEDLQPIHITAEVLEKNGFEKVEPQWYMCELNGIHISIIVWENQRGRIEISYQSPFNDDNPLYIADFTANIPHFAVHHLQRVLRLAGVEKEIVL